MTMRRRPREDDNATPAHTPPAARAPSDRARNPDTLLEYLQGAAGNRAVQELVRSSPTVQRQGGLPGLLSQAAAGATPAAPAPANAAFAALYQATVVRPIGTAGRALNSKHPDYEDVLRLLSGASDGITNMAFTYDKSDPLLAERLWHLRDDIKAIVWLIQPLLGFKTTPKVIENQTKYVEWTARSLESQLH